MSATTDALEALAADWAKIAEADDWDVTTPNALVGAALEAIAWALIDQTSDIADRPPSEATLYDAHLTAAKIVTRPAAHEAEIEARVRAKIKEEIEAKADQRERTARGTWFNCCEGARAQGRVQGLDLAARIAGGDA